MISKLPEGKVKDIAVEYDSERVRLTKAKRDLESRMYKKLAGLSDDELLELAGRCNNEGFTDHCLYCEAWGIWHGRQKSNKAWEV